MTHIKLILNSIAEKLTISSCRPPPPPPPLCNMNTNKKMEKPKRPLSAYNLFYRYKRILLLKEQINDDTDITKLMKTPPGLECGIERNVSSPLSSSEYLKERRRNTIRETLVDNLNPNTSPRIHKAGNSKLNFLEMSKLMVTSWKGIDEFALSGEWLICIVYMLFYLLNSFIVLAVLFYV